MDTYLTMNFSTNLGNKTLRVNNIKANLTAPTVSNAMDLFISTNVFPEATGKLLTKRWARVYEVTETEYTLT